MSRLYFDGNAEVLYTENETNAPRLWNYRRAPVTSRMRFMSASSAAAPSGVNPAHIGTKAGVWHQCMIAAGGKREFRLRLSRHTLAQPFEDFDATLAQRQREADDYYAELQKDMHSADERMVQRQAFAGLIWSKQFYYLDVPRWLKGDPASRSRRTRACPAATSIGAISTTPTSSRCPTSGSIPGTPPGIWRFIASPLP